MYIRFLKIKLKALAEEARIIRREEQRLRCSPTLGEDIAAANTAERRSLYLHRVIAVREAARLTHLAYGFLRGRSYTAIEGHSTYRAANWAEVLRMVRKYGARDTTEEALRNWYGKVEALTVKKVA